MTCNLLALKSLAVRSSTKFKPSHREREVRKGRMPAMAEKTGERKGQSMGCRAVEPMVDTGQASGPVLFLMVMLAWDSAVMPLFAHSPTLPLFREGIEGAMRSKAETPAVL